MAHFSASQAKERYQESVNKRHTVYKEILCAIFKKIEEAATCGQSQTVYMLPALAPDSYVTYNQKLARSYLHKKLVHLKYSVSQVADNMLLIKWSKGGKGLRAGAVA